MQLRRPAALLLLAAPSLAQSFNIDVGPNLILAPGPDSSYAGAAGQSGHWMEFTDAFTLRNLEDLTGGLVGATLESDTHSSFTVYPSVIGTAGDQELMEDAQWLPNLDVPVTWSFTGLENGPYEVYTYASDPTSSAQSEITVVGSSDPPQVVTGPWPGSHQLGVTYAKHAVNVFDGTLTIVAMGYGPQPNNAGALNGFQLVHLGGPGTIGTNYCGPANLNSSGLPAIILATGSDTVAHNSLTLTAQQMPTNQFGYFVNSQTQGFSTPPGSQGNLCVAGAIGRHSSQIQSSGAAGEFSIPVDLTVLPTPGGPYAVQAGETWNFQAWFRDVNPNQTSNFTDGVSILFQ